MNLATLRTRIFFPVIIDPAKDLEELRPAFLLTFLSGNGIHRGTGLPNGHPSPSLRNL
jgi:hypothetical protein